MSRYPLLFAGALILTAATAAAQAPVGEVFAADASVRGSVLLAGKGTQVLSGSQVAAGARPAVLKLVRGGEVRICPNTMVGVTASQNGRTLLYSLSSGEMEFHLDIGSQGDALQTPDFRLQLVGPGHFDLAVCTDNSGRLALRGANNRSAVIVSEMLGDGVYQVPGGTSIDFLNGSVQNPTKTEAPCGCPESEEPRTPTLLAEQKPAPPPAPVAPVHQPPETHIQVDAPMIFHGEAPDEDVMYTVARLESRRPLDLAVQLGSQVLAPPPPQPAPKPVVMAEKPKAVQPPKKRGFFGSIGHFFGKIFGR